MIKGTQFRKAGVALGIALAFAAGTANANTCGTELTPCALNVNGAPTTSTVASGAFTDYFSFHLSSDSSVLGWALSSFNPAPTVGFTDLLLYKDGASTPSWNFTLSNTAFFAESGILGVGDYVAVIKGSASTATSYYANVSAIAAVPEPGEWAMILAGLGMVGVIARRRSSGNV